MVIRNVPTQRLSVPTSRVSGRPLTDTKAMKTDLLLKTAQAIQGIGNEISNRYSESQYDEFITQFEQDSALMFEENTKDLNKYGEFSDLTNKGFDSLEKNILKKSKNLNPSYTKKLKKYLLSKRTENVTRSISAASTAERAIIPSKLKNRINKVLINADGKNPDSPYMAETINNLFDYIDTQAPVIGNAAVELNKASLLASLEEAYVDKVIRDPEGNYGQFLPELSSIEEGTSPYEFKYLSQKRVNVLVSQARVRLKSDKTERAKALKDFQTTLDTSITNSMQDLTKATNVINGNISITESIAGLDAISNNLDNITKKTNQLETILQKGSLIPKDRKKLNIKLKELKEKQLGTKAHYKLMGELIEKTMELTEQIEDGSLPFVPEGFGDKYKEQFLKLSNQYTVSNPVLAKHFQDSAKTMDKLKTTLEKNLIKQQEISVTLKTPPEKRNNTQKTIAKEQLKKTIIQNNNEIQIQLKNANPNFNPEGISIQAIFNDANHENFYEVLKSTQNFGVLPEIAINNLESTFSNVDPKDSASRIEGVKAAVTLVRIGDALSNAKLQNGNYFPNNTALSKAIRIIKDRGPNFAQTEAGLNALSSIIFPLLPSQIPTALDAANPALYISQSIYNPSRTVNSNVENSDNSYADNIGEEWLKRKTWFGPDIVPLNNRNKETIFAVTRETMNQMSQQPGFDFEKYNTQSNIWDSDLYTIAREKVLDRISVDKIGRLTIDGIDSVNSKVNHHPKTVKNNFAMQLFNELSSSEIQKLIDENILTRIKVQPKSSAVKQIAPDSVFYPVPYNKLHLENNYHKDLTLATYERMHGFRRDGENTALTFTDNIGFNRASNIKITEDIGLNGLTFEEFITLQESIYKNSIYSESLDNIDFIEKEYKNWSAEGITKRNRMVPGYILTDKIGQPLFNGRVFSMPRSQTTKNELLYEALQDQNDKIFLRFLRVNSKGGVEAKQIKENLNRDAMKFLFRDRLSLEQLLKYNNKKVEVLGDL